MQSCIAFLHWVFSTPQAINFYTMKYIRKHFDSINLVTGFSPLLADHDEQVTVLVLGTAPSVKSLQLQQYYAHPQNTFWWIMGQLFEFDHQLAYDQRHKLLNENGVVVWDVLQSCEREGSLDSSIQFESEVANDIPKLLRQFGGIKKIICNGGMAFKLLKRHYPELFEQGFEILQMPSTSPANARMSKQEKLAKWAKLKLPNKGKHLEH